MKYLSFVFFLACWLSLPSPASADDDRFTYFHLGAHSHMTHIGGELGLGLPARLYFNLAILYHVSDLYGDWGPEYPLRQTGYYQMTSDDWILRDHSLAFSLTGGYDLVKSRGPCGQDPNWTCTGVVRLYVGLVQNLRKTEYEPLAPDAEDPDLRLEVRHKVARLGLGVGYSLGLWYIGLNAGVIYAFEGIAAEGGNRLLPALDFSMGFMF